MQFRSLDLLITLEGIRLKPYDDQTGKEISEWCNGATIGVGHLIKKEDWEKYKNGITREDAENLLLSDIEYPCNVVTNLVTVTINNNQFDALVLLCYNIGTMAFKNSSVLKWINHDGNGSSYPSLEASWKAWNKSQGKVMKGLDNRRQSEWNLYCKD